MVKINKITINKVSIFDDFSIELGNKNIIVGNNGVGKSYFFKIIKYMLTDDNQSLKNICCDPCSHIKLEIEFDDAERNIFIKTMLLRRLLSKINHQTNKDDIDKIMNKYDDVYNKLSTETIYRKIKVDYSYKYGYVIIKLNDEMSSNNNWKTNEYVDNMIGNSLNLTNSNNSNFRFVPYLEKNQIIRSLFDNGIYKSCSYKYDKNVQNGDSLILDHFICVRQYLKNISVINKSSYTKIKVPIPEENDNNIIIFDPLSKTKKYVQDLILNNRLKFDQCIADTFHKIMGVKIDTYTDNNDLLDIRLENKNDLSDGQLELFYFISELSNDKNILLIDEPCVHLAPQNKEIFRKEILEKLICNQLIMVTHTPIFVSEELGDNIIQLYLDNGITKYNKLEQKIKNNGNIEYNKNLKLIFEHRDALFAKKCLLVEGYHDKRVLEQFLKVIKNNDYFVIDVKGCNSNLWRILDKLNIPYKVIYDVDKIYHKENNSLEDNFKDSRLKILVDMVLYSSHLCDNDLDFIHFLGKNKLQFEKKIDKFNERFNKLSEQVEKGKNGKNHFLDKFYNCGYNDLLVQIKKLDNKNFNMISMYQLFNNKILIWNKDVKDIEGIGDIFYNDKNYFGPINENNINECRTGNYKDKWYDITMDDIHKNINNNMNTNALQILKNFCESKNGPIISIEKYISKFFLDIKIKNNLTDDNIIINQFDEI